MYFISAARSARAHPSREDAGILTHAHAATLPDSLYLKFDSSKDQGGADMNSAEAAEEGPNDSDTDAFFKTGRAGIVISATWTCASIDWV